MDGQVDLIFELVDFWLVIVVTPNSVKKSTEMLVSIKCKLHAIFSINFCKLTSNNYPLTLTSMDSA